MTSVFQKVSGAISIMSVAMLIPSGASANKIDLTATQPTLVICDKDEIALHANDGSITIKGKLISHQDAIYRVKTALGDLWIDTAVMQCEGAACPSSADVLAGIEAAEHVSFNAN